MAADQGRGVSLDRCKAAQQHHSEPAEIAGAKCEGSPQNTNRPMILVRLATLDAAPFALQYSLSDRNNRRVFLLASREVD